MSFYPPKIAERFRAPHFAGRTENADASGTSAAFVCGAAARFALRIDGKTKEISEARFLTNGCGFATAAADVLAGLIVGKKLSELHGADRARLGGEIENALGAFGAHRRHCLELCLNALQAAFADFRAAQIEEWAGEKAVICTCFGVSEETIENLVRDYYLTSVEEVTEKCGAGGGCGSCQPLIREIIDGA